MDKDKLEAETSRAKSILKSLLETREQEDKQLSMDFYGSQKAGGELSSPKINDPRLDIVDERLKIVNKINEQRIKQREQLLDFIIGLTEVITGVFICMLVLNFLASLFLNKQIFSDAVINTIGVAFFVELIATIKVVTSNLWDETQILNSSALNGNESIKDRKNNE